jgi:hypothetical protein
MKKLSFASSALVSPRVLLGVALVTLTSLLGGAGCASRSLTALTIQPGIGLTCVTQGVTAQFKAYGTYTESNHAAATQDITDQVTWSSTIPAVATVDPSTGLATGGPDIGQTDILATAQGEFGNLTATSNIQVKTGTECLTGSTSIAHAPSISVIPANQTLSSAGDTTRLLAIGIAASGARSDDVSRQVTWESSDTSVATVDAAGLVTAVGPGDVTITARQKTADGNVVSGTQTVHSLANGQDK